MEKNQKLEKFFSRRRATEEEKQEKAMQKKITKSQKMSIAFLLLVYIAYRWFGHLMPDFNLSALWVRTENIQASVMMYWYIPAWGAFLSFFVTKGSKKRIGLRMMTGIIAGVWEEIGYRGLFIFTSMILLILSNFFFEWFIVLLIIIVMFYCFLFILGDGWIIKLCLVCGIVLPLCYWVINSDFGANPVYWLYENIWFPILHFVSFGKLDSIIYNKDFSPLFIMGAMSANIRFRNGHSYQGPLGWLNSWAIGYVFLHAMIFHGIVVAIILHVVYNVTVHTVNYIKPQEPDENEPHD